MNRSKQSLPMPAPRLIAKDDVTSKSIVKVSSKASANLVDLRKPNSLTYGIDTDVSCARAHDAGQKFSQHVYNAAKDIDGILYESRFTGELCAVIFDRAVARCLHAEKCTPLTDETELIPALEEFNVALIPADDDDVEE
ncbi:RES family NAD+ phosphorylase [Gluconacetobacter entanii]|uniref:RES domain-containing protein n=1 Tax=Gluconacetobacter entanii TaxID=108528 RepID=UPI001C93550F|nr:RES domain-containing protein [Gluconacetobacter entanii]MBY4638898.1 RES family NAD+ phosphorylase [Gluconacetobacter entanii]MCW4578912.1 RES family NAD+ phosphorylase [Gluconacetobacter entanii]MCW4582321.1 RES family NAD+ phosphorylase [Gluconacetobacter entanii]MCW4585699.1 RES family NAD+ phosphorylase [Gluconacetobacter entanii]